jgi:hypothetical protein
VGPKFVKIESASVTVISLFEFAVTITTEHHQQSRSQQSASIQHSVSIQHHIACSAAQSSSGAIREANNTTLSNEAAKEAIDSIHSS